jgi:hypothetical protein
LRVWADDTGFAISEVMEDDEVEGAKAGRKIFNPHRGRKKQAAAFRKWAVANRKRLESMTFAQVLGALKRRGISFVKA